MLPKRKIVRTQYMKELNQKIRFGTHKGRTIQWVLDNDLPYMGWVIEKGDFIVVSQLVKDAYKTTLNLSR